MILFKLPDHWNSHNYQCHHSRRLPLPKLEAKVTNCKKINLAWYDQGVFRFAPKLNCAIVRVSWNIFYQSQISTYQKIMLLWYYTIILFHIRIKTVHFHDWWVKDCSAVHTISTAEQARWAIGYWCVLVESSIRWLSSLSRVTSTNYPA